MWTLTHRTSCTLVQHTWTPQTNMHVLSPFLKDPAVWGSLRWFSELHKRGAAEHGELLGLWSGRSCWSGGNEFWCGGTVANTVGGVEQLLQVEGGCAGVSERSCSGFCRDRKSMRRTKDWKLPPPSTSSPIELLWMVPHQTPQTGSDQNHS